MCKFATKPGVLILREESAARVELAGESLKFFFFI